LRIAPRAPLALAVAQPTADVESHAALVRRSGARVVVFPELSLTGYRYDAAPVAFDSLSPIVAACGSANAIALVGAVVDGPSIAVLRVDAAGVAVAYRKVFVAPPEQPHFKAGDGPVALEVDGWRIGVGICVDSCNAEHWEMTAALGIDVYAAGVLDTPDELSTQDERVALFRPAGVAVAFASYAGSTGEGYDVCAGMSRIWNADGEVIAHAGPNTNEVVTATLV
jgi:predicted amidohydrolase